LSNFLTARLAILERVRVLLAAVVVITATAGCTSLSTTTRCSTITACRSAGSKHLGQGVLMPQGATFLQGAVKGGVLGVEFRDPQTGRMYTMFVGHPGAKPACPGTVVVLSPTKQFCYGRTTTALMAQFTSARLLYTLSVSVAATTAASDQELVTRLVSTLT
jgi:hypothetical protein